MHLCSSSLAQKPYDTRAGRARTIESSIMITRLPRTVEAIGLSLILTLSSRDADGRNERAPDIFILDKSHSVRDARSLGIPDCRVYSGIGNADHDIGIDGMLVRKEASGAFPRLMNAHPFDKRIGARKVDILENAERLFRPPSSDPLSSGRPSRRTPLSLRARDRGRNARRRYRAHTIPTR